MSEPAARAPSVLGDLVATRESPLRLKRPPRRPDALGGLRRVVEIIRFP